MHYNIDEFWEWFQTHSKELVCGDYDVDILNKLDSIISAWDLGWEIGPGLLKRNSFTISPNGNPDKIPKAKNIIAQAPVLEGWEFYAYKQSKTNWDKAKLIEYGIEVDASGWTYQLLRYPDDKLEILIMAKNLQGLDNETRDLAVDLVLTNLLGEELKMVGLDFIAVVDNFDDQKGITELQFLPRHLKKINDHH